MNNRDEAYKYIPTDKKRRKEIEVEVEDQEQRPKYTISVSDWLIVMLIQVIPVVNIIFLLIWAFGKRTPVSKSNWAKASLIVLGIIFVFYFLILLGTVSSFY